MAKARGFTLIELLVAMAIVGIVVALVAVSARPSDRTVLELEATRLAASLALAAREARLTGDTIVWRANGSAYAFSRHAERPGSRESAELRPRTLPSGVTLSVLSINGVVQRADMRLDFAPSVPIALFSVDMVAGDARTAIASTATGDVKVLRATEPYDAPR